MSTYLVRVVLDQNHNDPLYDSLHDEMISAGFERDLPFLDSSPKQAIVFWLPTGQYTIETDDTSQTVSETVLGIAERLYPDPKVLVCRIDLDSFLVANLPEYAEGTAALNAAIANL